jgi:hypothetical protein
MCRKSLSVIYTILGRKGLKSDKQSSLLAFVSVVNTAPRVIFTKHYFLFDLQIDQEARVLQYTTFEKLLQGQTL